jgi:hypothetical protein
LFLPVQDEFLDLIPIFVRPGSEVTIEGDPTGDRET